MAVSYNKKELEKKRQSKKVEKQKRKEERKAGGSSSFDEMIAYVDENGMLTSTPPDQSQKEKIDPETILVSTPKKEDIEILPLKGRVEHFDTNKGYGFIKDTSSAEKYFFHISNAFADIKEGNLVTFELERGKKGMNAVKIVLVK